MFLVIATGMLLAVVTIAIHASTTSFLIDFLRARATSFKTRFGGLKALMLTALGLLSIHVVETMVWAVAYWLAVGGNDFANIEDAVYFSTVTFTTLGYGDIVITGGWKMLGACQAMTGLLVFGWSTAMLFAVVQKVWQQRIDPS